MHPSTVSVVSDFIARQRESNVPSRAPGAEGRITEYDSSVAQLGLRISESSEELKHMDEEFKSTEEGRLISEIAKKYWDDPEFAEQQRREIAEGKARKR